MANPAAYATIRDGSIKLEIGGDIDHAFAFDAPGVDAGRKSVLSFVADPVINDGENVSVEFDLNGVNILTHLFDTAPARAMQEIVGENLLKEYGNKLKVRLTDTDNNGALKIDDVVLLYTQTT
jgi:hypothetical protein